MNRIFTASLLLALVCAPAFARRRQQPAAPRLIDSFGEINWSDLIARLDNFTVELRNEPGSKGVVVFYSAKQKFPAWPRRRADASLDYLVNTRGLDASRLSILNGGLREETTFELWVVPPGAELPLKPFDVSLLMTGERTPLPLDRFFVIERGGRLETEYGGESNPTSVGLFTYFAEVLKQAPSLRGCVIGYASRRGPLAAGRRIAALAKLTMAKSHAVDVSRVVALGGGRRDYKTIELWLVPPGAELPGPTPTVRAPRRRRR
jgi:hypothetical protein